MNYLRDNEIARKIISGEIKELYCIREGYCNHYYSSGRYPRKHTLGKKYKVMWYMPTYNSHTIIMETDNILVLNMIYEVIHAENNSIDDGIVIRRLDLNSTNLYSKKRFESIKKIRKQKLEKLNEEV